MTVTDPAAAAAATSTWDELAVLTRGCVACPALVAGRTTVVAGVLPAGGRPDVLLVGEAPGAQEDQAGVPFVGRSGQLLDQLLVEAGLSRSDVGITNVLKCRPPGNRKPKRAEVTRCRPWLERQIALAGPRVLVALGGTATEWFVGPGARITALRGSPLSYAGRPLVVTYHPSAAIRFGPNGAPLAGLRDDLRRVALLLGTP